MLVETKYNSILGSSSLIRGSLVSIKATASFPPDTEKVHR